MPRDQESNLTELQTVARGIRRDPRESLLEVADELEEHAQTLREQCSVPIPIRRNKPTAALELDEDELRYGIECIPEDDLDRPEAVRYLNKLMRALAVESGPGGNFNGDQAA